jgi:hypothetical protein
MAPRDEGVVDKIFAGSLEDLPPLRDKKSSAAKLTKKNKRENAPTNKE